jgi:hypothetical protein
MEREEKIGNFMQETVVDFRKYHLLSKISYRSDVTVVGKLATFGEK